MGVGDGIGNRRRGGCVTFPSRGERGDEQRGEDESGDETWGA